ncbi:MAG: YggS family pyridoxal phosphate-dependent enzyme [Gammaproteobacteria bacterium]|nr:YggS family pyridoxal phosphate-dependent enzyme [Gammaproteobacteria bacterium]MCW5583623.1 YggS family pyridoxal phosphate-dependent enzyme [Gammaproteobacteria bacterium]
MTQIEKNILAIKKLIADYEKKYHREPHSVRLLAVSKGKSANQIAEAYQVGQSCFGENYLQEALLKIAALSDKQIEWHFIGPIQSNKTRKIAEHFAWVHSVDNIKIARRLNDQRPSCLPPINICIEVNVSNEETKSGTDIDNIMPLISYCQTLPRLTLRGLMAIPVQHKNFTDQRNECRKLCSLWQSLRDQGILLDTLSMGMSNDFEAAIAEGSTLVRIGTAIFGERHKHV